jgi:hypothetical protein
MGRPCPHCDAEIDYFKAKWWEQIRCFGTYDPDDGHQHDDSETIDDGDFEYSCPECSRAIVCDDPATWFDEGDDGNGAFEPLDQDIWSNAQGV